MAKQKTDPFMITDDEIAETKSMVSQGSSGLLCPKMNKAIGGKCKVCDYLQTEIYAKKYDENHPARKFAKDKRYKLTWFLNVVLPSNPDKAIFLELGDKVGNQLIQGIEEDGWRDVVHPHKGVGRELICKKTQGAGERWPTYTINPVLEKADWDIPDEVWKNVPDLRNMIEILQTEELTEENYMHIRSLKKGESLVFRMCPPQKVEIGEKKCVIAPIFRHWGVTEDQISGEEPMDWEGATKKEDKKYEEETVKDDGLDLLMPNEETPEKETAEKETSAKKEKPKRCFGNDAFFEEDDETNCKPCPYFRDCMMEVMSA